MRVRGVWGKGTPGFFLLIFGLDKPAGKEYNGPIFLFFEQGERGRV